MRHVTKKTNKQINNERHFFECQLSQLAEMMASHVTRYEIHQLKESNFPGTETKKSATAKMFVVVDLKYVDTCCGDSRLVSLIQGDVKQGNTLSF